MKSAAFFLSILVLLFHSVVAAQIYSWTDENGIRRFSDVAPSPEMQANSTAKQIQTSQDRINEIKAKLKYEAHSRSIEHQLRRDEAERKSRERIAEINERQDKIKRDFEESEKKRELERARKKYESLKKNRYKYMDNFNSARSQYLRQYWRDKIDELDDARRKLVELENRW